MIAAPHQWFASLRNWRNASRLRRRVQDRNLPNYKEVRSMAIRHKEAIKGGDNLSTMQCSHWDQPVAKFELGSMTPNGERDCGYPHSRWGYH